MLAIFGRFYYDGTAYRFDVDSRPMYGFPVHVMASLISVG